MALRQIIGFNHLIKGTGYGAAATTYGLALNSYGITSAFSSGNGTGQSGNTASITMQTDTVTLNAVYSGNHVSNSAQARMTINLTNKHTDGVARKSVLGIKCTHTASTANRVFATLCGVSFTNTECGYENNLDNYFEFVINRETNTVSVYNTAGTKVTEKAATTSLYSAGGTVVIGDGMVGTGFSGQRFNYALSRAYMLDDTQDDTPCDRMGPIDLVPVSISAVDGSDSTTSNGDTLVNVINTVMTNAASMIAPYIQTNKSQQPLICTIGATGDPYATIKGLAMMISSKKDAGTDARFQVGMKLGSTTVQGGVVGAVDSNWAYFSNFDVQNKAADGMPFTWDKINATKVIMTPVSGNP